MGTETSNSCPRYIDNVSKGNAAVFSKQYGGEMSRWMHSLIAPATACTKGSLHDFNKTGNIEQYFYCIKLLLHNYVLAVELLSRIQELNEFICGRVASIIVILNHTVTNNFNQMFTNILIK